MSDRKLVRIYPPRDKAQEGHYEAVVQTKKSEEPIDIAARALEKSHIPPSDDVLTIRVGVCKFYGKKNPTEQSNCTSDVSVWPA